jgi:membrane associated rhomboid family serine protease
MAKRGEDPLLDAIEASATIVFVLFAVFYVNVLFLSGQLNLLGIVPRTLRGVIGIVCSPLLHYNSQHLMANGVSLLVLLAILFSHRDYRPKETLAGVWLLSGLGTWVIGRNAMHIGASGVVYGVIVYLVAAGWYLRDWRSALIAAGILLLYGGAFHGILPQPGVVSWEGHLSGAVAGLLIARRQHR